MADRTGTRYLVTGGAGFIGSYLVNALLARGDTVVALDNLQTGRLTNLEEASESPHFHFVHGSVLDELVVDELVHQCDVVVHMAAAVGVRLVVEQPLKSLTTNIRGSQVVIEAAHRYRRKILMTSTSEIYGKNSLGPLHETADRILGSPSIVRWAYSTAKAVDEILANCYHRERGLPTIVVRLFNTVGARQSPAYGMVIPRLVQQALRDEPLTVYGDGRADPLLRPRARRRGGAAPPARRRRGDRADLQHRVLRGDQHRPPRGGDRRPLREQVADRADPLRRGVRGRPSRTCSGGCPTRRSCARSPAGSRATRSPTC